MKANTYGLIKTANRCLVLNTIKDYGPITTEDLVFQTRLSRPTILSLLKSLEEENIVFKSGYAENAVGRQPALFSLNNKSYFAIGIDCDLPPVRLAISDLSGNIIYSRQWEMDMDESVQSITESLSQNINASIKETNLNYDSIIGLGLGLPAIVNINENKAVRVDRVPEWRNFSLKDVLTEKTGLEIYTRNDAHLLSMVEMSFLDKQVQNALYIVHRSGIGMSIFINGKLYEGSFGNAGYIGHTCINIDGNSCECGNSGCLETYCSKRAIIKDYYEKTKTKKTYHDIIALADQKEDNAIAVLESAGRYLGCGIANTVKLFDATHVVLGDLDCSEENPFYKSIQTAIDKNLAGYTINEIKIIFRYVKRKRIRTWRLPFCN